MMFSLLPSIKRITTYFIIFLFCGRPLTPTCVCVVVRRLASILRFAFSLFLSFSKLCT